MIFLITSYCLKSDFTHARRQSYKKDWTIRQIQQTITCQPTAGKLASLLYPWRYIYFRLFFYYDDYKFPY